MRVSRKPRTAASTLPKSKSKTKTPVAGALPDRRAMESVLAAIGTRSRDDAIAKAQEVMYEAWDRATSRSRIALAHKALAISPLCADAFNLLAEEAASPAEARDLYARDSMLESLRSVLKALRNMKAISGVFSKPARTCALGTGWR